eukprot:scaffold75245_cov29-Tisochrysis_lutea.AAC.5
MASKNKSNWGIEPVGHRTRDAVSKPRCARKTVWEQLAQAGSRHGHKYTGNLEKVPGTSRIR